MSISQGNLPAFLSEQRHGHLIDGRMVPAQQGDWVDSFSPADGRLIAQLARGREADVDLAVRAARRAFEGPWSRFTPAQRQKLLIRVHDVIEQHFDEIVTIESLDMGAPLTRLRGARNGLLQSILYFASQAHHAGGQTIPNSLAGRFTTMTIKAPVGVVGGIIPWNGPLFSQWGVIGAALATGCTAVIKPAEDASLTVLRTAQLLLEAGVPEGVINVVTGLGSEAGAALARHPDVNRLSFTGSTGTGREIIKASAVNMKRLQLELGGKSPDIIFADADLDRAVPGAGMGVFGNSGQVCFAGTRIFVERKIQEAFVERLAAFGRSLKVGHPLQEDVILGPLISQRQLERVQGFVQQGSREGAQLVSGGERLGGDLAQGYYLEPTVFSEVHNSMAIAQEEIFGPVASVISFDTPEQALALANQTEFGLGGAVWTSNIKTAMNMVHGIQAGTVWVNCYGAIDPAVGFGGVKNSGYGWKGGTTHIDGFLYQKAVVINTD